MAIVSGQYASNGEARRAISQGGLSINDERVGAGGRRSRAYRRPLPGGSAGQEEPADRPAEG